MKWITPHIYGLPLASRPPCGRRGLALRKVGARLAAVRPLATVQRDSPPISPAKGKPMASFSEKGHFPTPFPLKCPLGKVAGAQSNKTYQVGKWPFLHKKNAYTCAREHLQSTHANVPEPGGDSRIVGLSKKRPLTKQKLPQIHTKTSTNPYAQTKLSLPLPPLYQPSGVPSTLSSIF